MTTPTDATEIPAAASDAASCTPVTDHAIGVEAALSVATTLKALADPLRLRILSAIATDPRGESCVCDLAALADVAQPTISHHLKVLRTTGLLASERRGTWVWYRIMPARKNAVTALLDSFAPDQTAQTEPGATESTAERTAALRTMDARISRLADELTGEYGALNRDVVTMIVRESYAGLVRSAKLTQHLIPLTERFARQRLADVARDRRTAVPQVLFVCVANAGRSQLAAAIFNTLAGGRAIARSAGSDPAVDLHPSVRSLVTDLGAADAYPKPLTDDAVRAADVVITMGCGDVCPVIEGVQYEDWSVGDPALASEAGTAAIRDDITTRVRTLLDSLPVR